jgi:hypothetical protein
MKKFIVVVLFSAVAVFAAMVMLGSIPVLDSYIGASTAVSVDEEIAVLVRCGKGWCDLLIS